MFSNAGGGVFIDDGPPGLTFDGTSKVLGNLVFGAAGVQVIIDEIQDVTGDTFTFTVFAVAEDAAAFCALLEPNDASTLGSSCAPSILSSNWAFSASGTIEYHDSSGIP